MQKGDGVKSMSWWPIVKDVADLVMDVSDFDLCVRHQGSWLEIKETLLRTVNRYKIGAKVFGRAADSVEMERMVDRIKQHMINLGKLKTIQDQDVRDAKASFTNACQAEGLDVTKPFPKPMILPVVYRS